jgi:two-component system CheB/CheR fusion protein
MENEKVNSKILKNNYIPTAEFYSQIIDSLQDYSIFTLDNEFVINSWSSGSTKIFGYEPDEIIGEHFDVIFTEDDIQNGIPKNEIETALKEGRATDNRWHICKDKSEFYAYGLVFPLTGIDGELLGYVKILRDLTERKKSEDAKKICKRS